MIYNFLCHESAETAIVDRRVEIITLANANQLLKVAILYDNGKREK